MEVEELIFWSWCTESAEEGQRVQKLAEKVHAAALQG